jgi:hypothetical protein
MTRGFFGSLFQISSGLAITCFNSKLLRDTNDLGFYEKVIRGHASQSRDSTV